MSATFVSARTGWLLGVTGCHPNRCRRLVLRKTTDHGRHWFPAPAPPAPFAAPGRTPAPGAVGSLRFADGRDGWAYGPGLWSTHDGGRTWHELSLNGRPVRSLEAADGRVLAAVTGCAAGRQNCYRFRVYSSPVTRDRWRRVPGAYGTWSGYATATAPQLTLAGGTGLVTAATANQRTPLLLTGPENGSAPWHRLAVPCPQFGQSMHVAATPTLGLAITCASEPGAGEQLKQAFFSPDDGRTWRRLTDPPSGGYLDAVSVTPAGTILLSGGRSDVYASWDGGLTWHGTARSSASMERAYQGGDSLIAAMTTDTQGFTLQADNSMGSIWFSYDDAHTWHKVTVR